MFQFSKLPATLKPSIIEVIEPRELEKLVSVSKDSRSLVLSNGPISKRVQAILIYHQSVSENDGRLFTDRLQICIELGGKERSEESKIQIITPDYNLSRGDIREPQTWTQLILNPVTKWPFMRRITACRVLSLPLYKANNPESIQRDLDECFEFYKLLPNLRHSQDLIISIKEHSQLTCIQREFPIHYQQRLRFQCEQAIGPGIGYESLVSLLGNCSDAPEDLYLELNTHFDQQAIRLMCNFRGHVRLYSQVEYFGRHLEAIIAYSPWEDARFQGLKIYTGNSMVSAAEMLGHCDSIIKKDPTFEPISNHHPPIRDSDDANKLKPVSFLIWELVHFGSSNLCREYSYHRRITESKELAVLLSFDECPLQGAAFKFLCEYRDAKQTRKRRLDED